MSNRVNGEKPKVIEDNPLSYQEAKEEVKQENANIAEWSVGSDFSDEDTVNIPEEPRQAEDPFIPVRRDRGLTINMRDHPFSTPLRPTNDTGPVAGRTR